MLDGQSRQDLQAMARSRQGPRDLAQRAKIIFLAAEGLSNIAIAQQLGLAKLTVGKWRRRFLSQGLTGLYEEFRPGRPRSISDEQVAALIQKTLYTKPHEGTDWTLGTLATETKLSKTTVFKIFRAFGLLLHRQKHLKLSSDPFFVEKVREIVGLYLNPPHKALVLGVDKKSQTQSLDRTQPVLPEGLGYVEGVAPGYVRNGPTPLFVALDIAIGQVLLNNCQPHHPHQKFFLSFLNHLETNVPLGLDVHLVVDDSATLKPDMVRRWLAARPRYHLHCTPSSSSWLDLVEIWFHIITQRAIRRGVFRIVTKLIAKIEDFVTNYDVKSGPFMWTATADSILDKLNISL